MRRLIFTARRVFPWRAALGFVVGALTAAALLGLGWIGSAHGAEFRVDTGKRVIAYQVRDCLKARDKIVAQRRNGAVGIRFYCDGRRI